MKKIVCALLFILPVIAFSCKDDDDCSCSGEIYGKWEALVFLSLESRAYPKDEDYNPTIEFKEDGTIAIRLDANSCFGDFELNGESGIGISNAGCTKICCDSDFSQKFVQMLPQVSSYSIKGNKLKLNVSGWGWIELGFVSD